MQSRWRLKGGLINKGCQFPKPIKLNFFGYNRNWGRHKTSPKHILIFIFKKNSDNQCKMVGCNWNRNKSKYYVIFLTSSATKKRCRRWSHDWTTETTTTTTTTLCLFWSPVSLFTLYNNSVIQLGKYRK